MSPSWVDGICSVLRTRAGELPPCQEGHCSVRARQSPHYLSRHCKKLGVLTAATYGDIFQTLLTALVRILMTTYQKGKK